MNGFDPGDGWREVEPGPSREQRLALITDGVIDAMWVREVPVPPLPTEPWTVIRVTWKDGQPAKEYALIGGRWGVMRPDELAEQMAGFEVLAEPIPRVALYQEQQRVARDVLADVRHAFQTDDETLAMIAQRYGVSS